MTILQYVFFHSSRARQLGLQSPALALVQLVGLEFASAVRLYACKVKNPGEFHDAINLS